MNITFSLDQLNNILRKLRGNEKDQFTGLDSLATMLIYGGGAQLSRLPCSELCALLVNILRTTNKEKYREMAALCIFHVLEVHPGTFQFFMQQNLLAIFDSLINPSSSNDFLENSIQALSSFAKISPFDIGKQVGISIFLRRFDSLCPATQRNALTAISIIAQTYSPPSFSKNLLQLCNIMANSDEKTIILAAQCFSNIVQKIGPEMVQADCLPILFTSISRISDPNLAVLLISQFYQALCFHQTAVSICNEIMKNYSSFDSIGFNEQTKIKRPEICNNLVDIILILIAPPKTKLPRILWEYSIDDNQKISTERQQFAINIQPFLVKLLINRFQYEDMILLALSASTSYSPIPVDSNFSTILLGLSLNNQIIPYIVGFLLNTKDLKPFIDNGLLQKLNSEKQPKKFRQWLNKSITKLRKRAGFDNANQKQQNAMPDPSLIMQNPTIQTTLTITKPVMTPISNSGTTSFPQMTSTTTTTQIMNETSQNETQNKNKKNKKKRGKSNQFAPYIPSQNKPQSEQPTQIQTPTKVIQFNKITKIDDIIAITNSSLSPFEIVSNGLCEKITKFLRTMPLKFTPAFISSLQKLCDYMKTNLEFYRFPVASDPIGNDFESFSDFSYPIDVIFGDEEFRDITVDLTADLVAIEAFVNQQCFKNVNEAKLRKVMQVGEMKGLIDPSENSIRSCSVFGYLARSFNMYSYKKMIFKLNGYSFPAQEPLWHVLTTVYSSIDELLDSRPVFYLEEGDCPRPTRKVHMSSPLPKEFAAPLDLLSAIHTVCAKHVNFESQRLTETILPQLSAVSLTSGLYSEAISLFYNYPYLFTFEARSLAFKLSSFDMPCALYTNKTQFLDTTDRSRLNAMRIKVHTKRSNIFEDGKKVLSKIPGTVRIEVDFIDEMGVGVGPTQEFYTLLSREFCRPSLHLWRNETPESEFCFCKKGLFPSPNADPNDMYLFGVLCAKALAASCLIDVPFSDAFFKALRGEQITLEDVDETFAQSLKSEEGLIGLNFTYPGIPSLELIKGGTDKDVTKENVGYYVKLITDFTIGNNLKPILDAFKRGFSTIIQFESTFLFTAEEMNIVLCGYEQDWSIETLKANIGVEHGYNIDSKEIQMLFEVLLEMTNEERMLFLKFVTGSSRLPIGGLSALRPKLTVARKDDDDSHLPSVMTCTNYFKMPPYSSKEIMKEKILIAISEGQGAFSFS